MTYFETLLLIEERGERVLAQEVRFLITDQHRYIRERDGDSPWQQDLEPGKPESRFGRGGEYFVWKREEAPNIPAQFPEGT